jgi:hypothetical protein
MSKNIVDFIDSTIWNDDLDVRNQVDLDRAKIKLEAR